MKKLFVLSLIFGAISCGTETTETTDTATTDVNYGYDVKYSKFEIGDPSYAQKIAELWKDYDNNELDKHMDYFADSLTIEGPGWKSSGPRDSVMAGVKADRSSYTNVVSSVVAIVSAKNTNEPEPRNFVMIWGSDKKTAPDGKIDSSRLHEVWGFNKEGKVDYMTQFKQ